MRKFQFVNIGMVLLGLTLSCFSAVAAEPEFMWVPSYFPNPVMIVSKECSAHVCTGAVASTKSVLELDEKGIKESGRRAYCYATSTGCPSADICLKNGSDKKLDEKTGEMKVSIKNLPPGTRGELVEPLQLVF